MRRLHKIVRSLISFSNARSFFAAFSLFALMGANARGADFEPMVDVTKLEKPTICLERSAGLYLIDWDGQNRRLWMTGNFNGAAEWSPDGRYASFIANTPEFGLYTHYILELETGRLINMTERLNNKGFEHLDISGAWWFPNSRHLACSVNDRNSPFPGKSDIYALDFRDETTLEQLTDTLIEDEHWASVSADGKIAFVSDPLREEDLVMLELPRPFPSHLYTMNADGTDVVNLTMSAASESYPEWSPDSKKIAFMASGRPEQAGEAAGADIFVMDPDGSNVERLTSREDGLWARVSDWSADSKWILFNMRLDDNSPSELYRIHIETREIVRIAAGGSAAWVLAGKSRFLSVDPAGKKRAQWGEMKKADAPQENSPEE